MLRILVLGANGMVGWEAVRACAPLGTIIGAGRDRVDIAERAQLVTLLDGQQPDVIINAAAYTAVDQAENEKEAAMRANRDAPAVLGAWARDHHAAVIHFSTDYVFDGTKTSAYAEHDETHPLSVYGESKLLGEHALADSGCAHLILRTSWVYATRGRNFALTMLRLARSRQELRVVSDQHGAPTWARALAQTVAALVARAGATRADVVGQLRDRGGVFHASCGGQTTWHGFARRVLDRVADSQRVCTSVQPIASADYPTAAARPRNSVLDNTRLQQQWAVALPAWDAALDMALDGFSP